MDINPFNIKISTKPMDIFIPQHVLIHCWKYFGETPLLAPFLGKENQNWTLIVIGFKKKILAISIANLS